MLCAPCRNGKPAPLQFPLWRHCSLSGHEYPVPAVHREEEGSSKRAGLSPAALTIRSRLSASTLPRSVTAPDSFLAAKSASKQRCQLVTAIWRQLDSVLGSAIATREVIIATPFVLFIDLHKGSSNLSILQSEQELVCFDH